MLSQAKARAYSDDESSWAEDGRLVLDGFVWERFHECDTSWPTRYAWLRRQPGRHLGLARTGVASTRDGPKPAGSPPGSSSFRPQPWLQTVKVLRDMGHDDDARELAMLREIMRAQSAGTRWHIKLWLHLLRVTIGNGYKPQRALYWSLGFFLLGWLVFAAAADLGFMAPRDGGVIAYLASTPGAKLPATFTRFNAPIYALDNFLPIVELGQDQAWQPSDVRIGHRRITDDSKWVEGARLALGHDWSITDGGEDVRRTGSESPQMAVAQLAVWAFGLGVHRFLYWFLQIAGWLFVSLYIAGMSGIVKNE
jgi:hypothetical protein